MLYESIFWLALNLYHEARGEPDKVQLAVAQVTINRAKNRNLTIKETVLQPSQFSWTLDRKKRRAKPWLTDSETFSKCSLNAIRSLHKNDITKGSTHYHESRVRPGWSKKLKKTVTVGPFKFYRNRKT